MLTKVSLKNRGFENEINHRGSLITSDNDCSAEIRRRIVIASRALDNFQEIWNSKNFDLAGKKTFLQTCVFSSFPYSSETWTLKKVDRNKINAFQKQPPEVFYRKGVLKKLAKFKGKNLCLRREFRDIFKNTSLTKHVRLLLLTFELRCYRRLLNVKWFH